MAITLPLSAAPQPGAAPEQPPGRTPLGGQALVVDDEEALCTLVAGWLRQAGFTVHTAGTARDAILFLQKTAVDLVVSDIVMPGDMNGLDLHEFVSEVLPDTKVLMVSGYSEDAVRAPHLQQLPLLTKPFREAELLAAVFALLHGRASQTSALATSA